MTDVNRDPENETVESTPQVRRTSTHEASIAIDVSLSSDSDDLLDLPQGMHRQQAIIVRYIRFVHPNRDITLVLSQINQIAP